jgi:hypothetical protein
MKKISYFTMFFVLWGWLTSCGGPTAEPTLVTPPRPQPTTQPTEPRPALTPTASIKPLGNQPGTDAPIIAYNEIKEGMLTDPGAVDNWAFNANAGERVSIVLNSEFDSFLELFNPAGQLIASNDDRGDSLNAALFDILLEDTGQHVVKIRGYDGTMGSYVLALTGGHPTIGGGVLGDGETRTAVLSEQGLKWRYQGQPGEFLSIETQGEPGTDTFVSVYGPDGVLLASDDDSAGGLNSEITAFELPVSGLYTIRAHTINSTGLVTLTINIEDQPAGGGPLAAGQTQVGKLNPGQNQRWTFEGQAGQVINLSMISEDFDTFLELRDSQDNILAENDDGPDGSNALVELALLPANGTYTAVARSLTNEEGGDYEITLKQVKVAAGGGPLTSAQPVLASLVPEEVDTWSFVAETGDFISVVVSSDQFDAYLELFGPDGDLLTSDDDSGGGLNAALFDFSIPEDGEYALAVSSSRPQERQGGVYEVLLTVTDAVELTGQLQDGQSVARELKAGDQHTWTFSAEEDTYVTVRMESDTLDTYLSLYDANGELLFLNDDFLAKQAVIANFLVPRTGEYRVIARAYAPSETGDYTITFSNTDEELPINVIEPE